MLYGSPYHGDINHSGCKHNQVPSIEVGVGKVRAMYGDMFGLEKVNT